MSFRTRLLRRRLADTTASVLGRAFFEIAKERESPRWTAIQDALLRSTRRFTPRLDFQLRVARDYATLRLRSNGRGTAGPRSTTSLRFQSLRLFDVFHLEDLAALGAGIREMFPDLAGPSADGLERVLARAASPEPNIVSWRIGTLERGTGTSVGGDVRRLASLPEPFERIDVTFYQLPTPIFALAYDVLLTPAAAQRLIDVEGRTPIPRAWPRAYPWRRSGTSAVVPMNRARSLVRRESAAYLTALRTSAETLVAKFVRGAFLRTTRGTRTRLPAVEVYSLQGAPSGEELAAWRAETRDWDALLGDQFFRRAYADDTAFFGDSGSEDSEDRDTYRLVVRVESCPAPAPKSRQDEEDDAKDDPAVRVREGVRRRAERILDALQPALAVLETLEQCKRSSERIKSVVFSGIRRRAKLGRLFAWSDEAHRERYLLKRLADNVPADRLAVAGVEPGAIATLRRSRGETAEYLAHDLKDTYEFTRDLLVREAEFLSSALSDYISLRNTVASNRLAAAATLASTVAMLAAIVAVRRDIADLAYAFGLWLFG